MDYTEREKQELKGLLDQVIVDALQVFIDDDALPIHFSYNGEAVGLTLEFRKLKPMEDE